MFARDVVLERKKKKEPEKTFFWEGGVTCNKADTLGYITGGFWAFLGCGVLTCPYRCLPQKRSPFRTLGHMLSSSISCTMSTKPSRTKRWPSFRVQQGRCVPLTLLQTRPQSLIPPFILSKGKESVSVVFDVDLARWAPVLFDPLFPPLLNPSSPNQRTTPNEPLALPSKLTRLNSPKKLIHPVSIVISFSALSLSTYLFWI